MSKKFSDVVKSAQEGMLTERTEWLPFLPVTRTADKNKFFVWRNGNEQGDLESDENYRARMILIGEYEKAFSKNKTYQNGMQAGIMNYDLSNYNSIPKDPIFQAKVDKNFIDSSTGTARPFVPILNFTHDIDFSKPPDNQSSFFTECERRYKRVLAPNHHYNSKPNMEGVKARLQYDFVPVASNTKMPVIYAEFQGNSISTSNGSFNTLVADDQINYNQCLRAIFNPIYSFNWNGLDAALSGNSNPSSPSATSPGTNPALPAPGGAPQWNVNSQPSVIDGKLTKQDAISYYNILASGTSSPSLSISNFVKNLVYFNVEGKTKDVLAEWVSKVKLASGLPSNNGSFGGAYTAAFGATQYPMTTQQNADLVNMYFNGVKELCATKFQRIDRDLFFATPDQMADAKDNAERKLISVIGSRAKAMIKSMVANTLVNAVLHPVNTFKSVVSGARNLISKLHNAANNGPLRDH